MKAVLWTDLFQALLMFIGIFAILIKGFLDIGFSEVFRIGYEGGRIAMPSLGLNLTERYTVWNILFQSCFFTMINFGSNQIQIQRLLTLKNISRSRKTLYLSIPLHILFFFLTCVVGLEIYAHFYTCDPLTAPSKPITAADQLMPYYVITVLRSYPGLPGICICGVFSATLSTVSSAINSLSAVTMQDLVRPFLASRRYSENTINLTAKAITLCYGGLCILLTVIAASFGNLVQAGKMVWGMCGGPILSVFLLGMLTTRANEKGVLTGLLCSLCMTGWIGFGTSAHGPRPKYLTLSAEGCQTNSTFSGGATSSILNSTVLSSFSETSTFSTTSVSEISGETPYIFPLYRISYLWYAPLGTLIGVVVGYISSIIISHITGEYPDVADEFLSPILNLFSKKKKSFKDKQLEIPEEEEAEFLTNGFTEIVEIADKGGRFIFDEFSGDLTIRYSFWNSLINGIFFYTYLYGVNQAQVQRYLSLGNLKKAQKALMWSFPLLLLFNLIIFWDGISLYALFHDCDPMKDENVKLSSADQLMPYGILKIYGDIPGLTGLCIAGVFSASLGTLSSAVNALANITIEDFIKPFCHCKKVNDTWMAFIAKLLAIGYICLILLMALVTSSFRAVLEASNVVLGMTAGPILGMYILGMFTTKANEPGTLIGLLSGVLWFAWAGFGSYITKPKVPTLSRDISGCYANSTWGVFNATTSTPFTEEVTEILKFTERKENDIFYLYTWSYMWLLCIALAITIVVGYVASYVLSFCIDPANVKSEYLSPFVRKLYFSPTYTAVRTKASDIEMEMNAR
ncbi:Sodium-coupled monocarboxylate transporter 1 like protein [Argiope bruennichi]|nr:Sodium-coupled monocarboxylate transporter 1 like protein [Argiope bruennichi]